MKFRFISFAILLTFLFAGPARADLDKIKKLYAKARVQYFQLELQSADKTLVEAVNLAESSGTKDKFVARVYVLRGVLIYVQDKNKRADAQAMLIKGLKIDRKVKIDTDIVTPDLTSLYDQALKNLPPEIVKVPFKMFHTAPPRAKKNGRLTLVVKVQGNPPYSVSIYYRNTGLPIFTKVEMLPGGNGRFLITVPKELLIGKYLLYYFEVRKDSKGIVARAGTESRPYKVSLTGEDEVPTRPKGIDNKLVNITLGVGSGAGYISENKSVRKIGNENIKVNPGFAYTPFFALLEIGFMINPSWEIAAFYRLQIIELAHMAGVKAKWYFDSTRPFRAFLGFGVGGGQVRHTVSLDPAVPDFVDTTISGLGHAGLGIGIIYNFTPMVGLLVELYNTLHFPQIAFQIDLWVGLQLSF